MKNDFIPASDGGLRDWAANIATGITTQGPILGMTPTQVTSMKTDATLIVTAIDNSSAQQDLAKSATANKETVKAVHLKSIRNQVAVFKRSPTYTAAIGKLLGVEGSDVVTDNSILKPTLTASVSVAGITLKFNKQKTDGVNIYSKGPGENAFTFVARDTHSPYVDTRPKQGTSEDRQYYAIYVKNDEEIGLASDIITVAF